MAGIQESEVNHIVDAESEEQAQQKVEDFYGKKDTDFCVSHDVYINYCNEIIN